METKNVLKIRRENDIRRVQLSAKELHFDLVKELAQSLFGTLQEPFHFVYRDDEGDLISVSSEREFEEAIRVSSNNKNTLKLVVIETRKTKEPELPAHPFFQFRRREPVHPAVCDGCVSVGKEEENIRGTRYKCTSCPDYDLCTSCFETEKTNPGSIHDKEHSEHFLALENPIPIFQSEGVFDWRGIPQIQIANCDGCIAAGKFEESIILGTRFKCIACPDYDLCQECFNKERIELGSVHNKEHKIYSAIKSPFERGNCGLRRWNCCQKAPVSEDSNAEKQNQSNDSKVEEPAKSVPEPKTEEKQEMILKEADKKEEVQPPVDSKLEHKEEKEESAFARKLKQLEEMGFVDRERNILVLVNRKGKLVDAVKELLE